MAASWIISEERSYWASFTNGEMYCDTLMQITEANFKTHAFILQFVLSAGQQHTLTEASRNQHISTFQHLNTGQNGDLYCTDVNNFITFIIKNLLIYIYIYNKHLTNGPSAWAIVTNSSYLIDKSSLWQTIFAIIHPFYYFWRSNWPCMTNHSLRVTICPNNLSRTNLFQMKRSLCLSINITLKM